MAVETWGDDGVLGMSEGAVGQTEDAGVRTPGLPRATRVVLENGLVVVVTPQPHLSLASLVLFVRVGSRYEDPADNGLSHLLEHVLFRGCARYPDTHSLNVAIESVGTALDAATGPDFTTFEAVCLPERLEAMMGIVGAMMASPTFAGVEVEQRIIAEELQDEIDARGRDIDPDNLSKMKLFPGSSMGLKVGGTLAGVKRFKESDCRRWHVRHYGARNMVLSIAGPVVAERVVAAARAAFGELAPGEATMPQPAKVREDLPAFEHTRHSGPQVDLQLSWVLPAEADPDWPALLLAQRLLDDGTCARLRHRVVDQLGLAYHAGADLEVYAGHSVFTVATQTRPAQAVQVLDAICEVLDELGREPAAEAELARMRGRIELEAASLADSTGQAAYWHGLAELLPQGSGGIAGRWRRTLAVTPEALMHAVRAHLDRKKAQLTVVGDLEPVWRAALRHRLRRGGA